MKSSFYLLIVIYIYIYIYICAIKFTSQPLSNLIYSKKYNFP